MRNLKRVLSALLLMTLLASAVPVGAFALSGSDPILYTDLSRADFKFDYVPVANSDYALCLFSADGNPVQARAELWLDGGLVASGEGTGQILNARLVAGTRYEVRVHGSGSAVIEVARDALSRSCFKPMIVSENDAQGKMIAHAYDAHWYEFEALESALLLLSCMPEDENLNLSAMLFDDQGALIARFEELSGGSCMLRADTKAGQRYRVRVSAPDGGEGYYSLNLRRGARDDIPSALSFEAGAQAITVGDSVDLGRLLSGEAMVWISSAPQIASVSQSGVVAGLASGSAEITAYGMGSQAKLRVDVDFVPLRSIGIIGSGITLAAGDDAAVEYTLTPRNASETRLNFSVDDPEIASVNRDGVIRGLAEGETTLHVRNASGSASASVRVTVTPATRRYRALLIGEQNYPFAENSARNGSENSVAAIDKLLGTARFESAAFVTRRCADLSKAELIAEIRRYFHGASAIDVSLIYITCHGSYSGGMSFLELSDGSTLCARDLERELRGIAGTVVVLIDCCGSGGAIGAASDYAAFARGVTGAFAGAAISGSKYKLLVSAGLDQDSFRIAFNENADSGVMATVFARALCDAAGWNIDADVRGTMGADADYDGSISFAELYAYMSARVDWYLGIASRLTGENYRQSVQVYPRGDPFVLFERQ